MFAITHAFNVTMQDSIFGCGAHFNSE